MKKLVIAEKYSVAKDYADAVNAKRFDGYFESNSYVITWVAGHIYRLKNPDEYDTRYAKWRIQDLPIIPEAFQIVLNNSCRDLYNTIKKLSSRADIGAIIIGTDAGREGELIGRYILAGIKNKKPVYRLWVSAKSETAIKEAFNNMKDIGMYDNIYNSARARAECDWLLGINMTRAYSLVEGDGMTLHIGRCQTPILNLIYMRDVEIASFETVTFWEVIGTFETEDCEYSGKWYSRTNESTIIENQAEATMILNRVLGKKGLVESVNKEKKRMPHPLLHNQTTLQITMNRRYGFTAQKTLDIAQKLYEEYKILSYPRTSSQYISSSMVYQLPGLIRNIDFGKYSKYVNKIINMEKLPISKRMVDDSQVTDHTALIPIENVNMISKYQSLNADEKKVFDEVLLTFLACFFEDYEYESITIITKVESEYFKSKGIKKLRLGWRQVYDDEVEEFDIIDIKKGSEVDVKSCSKVKKVTEPPAKYTDGSLLEVMKNPTGYIEETDLKKAIKGKGIGTEATRANIIENLIERGYIRRDGKYLTTTPLGRDLVNIVDNEMLKSVELTAGWEEKLEKIASGEIDKISFLKEVVKFILLSMEQIKTD